MPVVGSRELTELLGPRNYPFFSLAIGQLMTVRFFHVFLACSIVAVVHMIAEWLYLGKYPQRFWIILIFALCLGGVAQVLGFQPRLREMHRTRYALPRPEQREAAGRSFRIWYTASQGITLLLICGSAVYFWRVANPADATRFVSTTKFRS
jgi:hypothetical protein